MGYLTDKDLLEFSKYTEGEREALYDELPFFTSSKPPKIYNELEILRRWNSHTPMLYDEFGGGYFLRWQGKGIVIDPGCTFVEVFRKRHGNVYLEPHCMDDIDLVVVTHDHIDHSEELATLITLLRTYNKRKKKKYMQNEEEYEPHKNIDLVLSYGVYFKCHTLLEHHDNRDLINCCKVLPTRYIEKDLDQIDLKTEYSLDLKCLKTQHKELLGDKSGFGIRFTLHGADGPFVLCDTGDTKYEPSLLEQYEGVDLLILHVGTLECLHEQDKNKRDKSRGEHLCFYGVVELLNQLKEKPKLVLLGEWGQEFHGFDSRKRFTEFVRKYAPKCVPILPADLGMRIRIPDCYVWCIQYKFNIGLKFQNDLGHFTISDDLQQEFKKNGISLSQNATISSEAVGSWLITDNDKTYIIEKERTKLNIYEGSFIPPNEVEVMDNGQWLNYLRK